MVSEEDLNDLGVVADRELPMESFAKRRASARERAGLNQTSRTEPDKPVRTGQAGPNRTSRSEPDRAV
jgi:hypothetical protein